MELKDTVELMNSDDYKERFKAEYYQLCIRRDKLEDMIRRHYEGTLNFVPTNPIKLLEMQVKVMNEYIDLLIIRAQIEGVEL